MIVFLDFEASSLNKHGYPIEVGWVFEDGRTEAHLIKPAPRWTDWDTEAQAIHGIARETLLIEGIDHGTIAHRMVEELSDHDLCASAPSWDGKWLSALLRAADLPRKTLGLRDSDDVLRETATRLLAPHVPAEALAAEVGELLTLTEMRDASVPAHRALADAMAERGRWLAIRDTAERRIARLAGHD